MEGNSIHSFQTESTTTKLNDGNNNITQNPEGNIKNSFPEIRLRRSQRFRKSVQFYGNFVSYLKTSTSNKNIKNKEKRRKKVSTPFNGKRTVNNRLHKNTRPMPLISVTEAGNGTKVQNLILEESGTKELTRILKQCTFPLPAVRCINEKTGECQIGVPKRKSISLKDERVVSQSKKSAIHYNKDDYKKHFSSTLQEQAILENLVSLVPYKPWYSNGLALQEISVRLLHDLQDYSCPHAKKINISHDDSKYLWI